MNKYLHIIIGLLFLLFFFCVLTYPAAGQVVDEGPVVAPTPYPTVRVIEGDPMPRIYLDYFIPWVGK